MRKGEAEKATQNSELKTHSSLVAQEVLGRNGNDDFELRIG
jgi:hypothetical protein